MPEIMSFPQPQRQNTRLPHQNVVQTRSAASTRVTPSAMSGYNAQQPPMGSSGNSSAQGQAWRNEATHPQASVPTRNEVRQGMAQQLGSSTPQNYGNSNGAYGTRQQSVGQQPVNTPPSSFGLPYAMTNTQLQRPISISNLIVSAILNDDDNSLRNVVSYATHADFMQISKYDDVIRKIFQLKDIPLRDFILSHLVNMNVVNTVRYAIANHNLDTLQNAIPYITKADYLMIAKFNDTVRSLFLFPILQLRNFVLDNIYEGIVNVELLKDAIGVRFGVPVGSSRFDLEDRSPEQLSAKQSIREIRNQEKEWTPNGAIHLYQTYLRLPQTDLDLIRCVLTLDTTKEFKGAAQSESGVYYVNYQDKYINTVEAGSHIDTDAKRKYGVEDTRKDLVLTDMTIAHELGHIVDANAPGLPYSVRPDFQALNGWKEYSIFNPGRVFTAIKDAFIEPYEPMTPVEMRIANLCGQRAIEQKADSGFKISKLIDTTVEECSDSLLQKRKTWSEHANSDRDWADLAILLLNSDIIKSFIGRTYSESLGNAKEQFAFMKQQIYRPYSERLTQEEERIANLIGETIINQKANTYDDIHRIVMRITKTEYNPNDTNKSLQSRPQTMNKSPQERTPKDTALTIRYSHVFTILSKLWASQQPWYASEPHEGMRYQIHQGYEGEGFFSYRNDALSGKISKYQFRDPKEDFAETYATFFVANPIGSKTPPKHREWFIKNGLDKSQMNGKYVGPNGHVSNHSNQNT